MHTRILVPADETPTHQIVDTFATVGQTDIGWTEKLWISAHAPDGSLQVDLGLGKYTNRNVMDGFAGISRGLEQWTVRGSRELSPHPEALAVGPIHYEIVEPLRKIRARLDANEEVPVSFDILMDGPVPPVVEDPWPERTSDGYRVSHDVIRYHQVGTATGWAEVDGARFEFADEPWIAFRDHSWGVRPEIGGPLPGLSPDRTRTTLPDTGGEPAPQLIIWCPMLLHRSDGTAYSIFVMYYGTGPKASRRVQFQGGEDLPSGEHRAFASMLPDLRFDNHSRRCLGGVLHITTAEGVARPLTLTPLSDTGFHIGVGLYLGYEGHWQGEWRGKLHVEGDHIQDCSSPETARKIHQLRDLLVRVEDPVGGGVGYANIESIASGAHPDLGLTAEASFL